jgi:glycyl-tRNA synthetase alpha chain
MFQECEAEGRRLLERGLVLPAYDYALRCSHTFNVLEARGGVSVTERTGFIQRVRKLAVGCAKLYLDGPQQDVQRPAATQSPAGDVGA